MKKLFLFSAAILFAAVTMAQTISSSTVSLRYCFSTSSDTSATTACGPFMWHGINCNAVGDYEYKTTNARGCDSIVTLHLTAYADNRTSSSFSDDICKGKTYRYVDATYSIDTILTTKGEHQCYGVNSNGCRHTATVTLTEKICPPDGAIPSAKAVFSVSEQKKVYFSQGNLQYMPSKDSCRFALNQYDANRTASQNVTPASTNTTWVDLFCWGSGNSANRMYWYANSSSPSPAWNTYNGDNTISLPGSIYDWGRYPIGNGGKTANMWCTLTKAEWDYLLGGSSSKREDAVAKRELATVCGMEGLLVLPDVFDTPQGITISKTIAAGNYNFTTNVYGVTQWALLESEGCLFLPMSGSRNYNSWEKPYGSYVQTNSGNYWTGSGGTVEKKAYYTQFGPTYIQTTEGFAYYGMAVRLVYATPVE